MSTMRTRTAVLIVSTLAVASSCTEGFVNEPQLTDMPEAVSQQLPEPEQYRLLHRQPLTQARSVTRRIDARGGTLEVDGALLIVPAGALDSPVDITLTVPEGDAVRADFQPHGLQFRKPAILAFSVAGSGFHAARAAQDLMGAYFVGEPADGVITTREVNPAFTYGHMAAFQIWHFCSYGLVPRKGLILVGG